MLKLVFKLEVDDRNKGKALKAISSLPGFRSITLDIEEKRLILVGTDDPIEIVKKLRRLVSFTELLSVGPGKEKRKTNEGLQLEKEKEEVIERSERDETTEKRREEKLASTELEEQYKADKKLQDATWQLGISNKNNKDSTTDNITTFLYSDLQQATSDFSDSNKLGQGGYGKVYKGNLLGEEVAIKILLSPGDSHQVKAFHQEIDILCRVQHSHLVRLIGACPEKYALIYEFMHGGTLEARLVRNDLPWQNRIRIATEICDALMFLHSLKPNFVVHGDLKPENVLIDSNGKSKLGDFGICRLIPISNTTTTAHRTTFSLQGSFGYLDPVFFQSGRLTQSTDVYAFGMVLLRLLSNKREGIELILEVEDALENKCLDNVLDTTTKWPSHFAEELANLAIRCCRFRVRERPNLADEVCKKLEKMKVESLAYSSLLQ